jgi:hypothetical protein
VSFAKTFVSVLLPLFSVSIEESIQTGNNIFGRNYNDLNKLLLPVCMLSSIETENKGSKTETNVFAKDTDELVLGVYSNNKNLAEIPQSPELKTTLDPITSDFLKVPSIDLNENENTPCETAIFNSDNFGNVKVICSPPATIDPQLLKENTDPFQHLPSFLQAKKGSETSKPKL